MSPDRSVDPAGRPRAGSDRGSAGDAEDPGSGPRVLLFTGKGGVGKTTTAAATAVGLAEQGHRVVVTSADPAHSLADVFGVPVGGEPTAVSPGCDAQQLDALSRMEDSWGEMRAWMVDVLDWAGLSAVESEELALLPGFEELVALMEIERLAAAGAHDVVIVDCAPTAETVRLLSLPDVLDWYIRHLFPASRRLTRLVRPVLSAVSDVPVAKAEVFDSFERFHEQLIRVRELLTNPRRTTARIVLTPERVVAAEAKRTLTYLALFGYRVDAVVVNRLAPGSTSGAAEPAPGPGVQGPNTDFLSRMRAAHREQLATIRRDFEPLRILSAEMSSTEVVGVDRLTYHGKALWDGVDPLSVLSPDAGMRMEHDGDLARLLLPLPSVTSGDVDLVESDAELVVTVGPYRRNLALPASLRSRSVTGARISDSELVVEFGPRRGGTAGSERP
jgi:arsenite-transporting ATPase